MFLVCPEYENPFLIEDVELDIFSEIFNEGGKVIDLTNNITYYCVEDDGQVVKTARKVQLKSGTVTYDSLLVHSEEFNDFLNDLEVKMNFEVVYDHFTDAELVEMFLEESEVS